MNYLSSEDIEDLEIYIAKQKKRVCEADTLCESLYLMLWKSQICSDVKTPVLVRDHGRGRQSGRQGQYFQGSELSLYVVSPWRMHLITQTSKPMGYTAQSTSPHRSSGIWVTAVSRGPIGWDPQCPDRVCGDSLCFFLLL